MSVAKFCLVGFRREKIVEYPPSVFSCIIDKICRRLTSDQFQSDFGIGTEKCTIIASNVHDNGTRQWFNDAARFESDIS